MVSRAEQCALVTGSAQGIGAAIVAEFQQRGIRVIGVDRSNDEVSDEFLQVDLADWDAVHDLAKRASEIDILVNNAALLNERSVKEYSQDDFAVLHNVNLRAPFILCRELGPLMMSRGFGRIVNISSVGSRTGGLSDSAVYSASKAGLNSMTKHFARILGPGGVTCNAVLPGAIETPMAKAQWVRHPDLRSSILDRIPVGRFGTGEDVAHVVAFLASEGAGFVNGVSIDVNGGWVMV